MAGIGFELKKLFSKKGVLNTARAFGYAAVVTTGPMLLGVALLLGVMLLCYIAGSSMHERELLVCMITYTLLASLMTTSFFSMVVTRYISDMLYEDKKEEILPSFWGSNIIMMAPGLILYGIFLLFSGANILCVILMLIFFGELIITWNAMSYLTAVKDYKGIFLSFFTAIAVAFILGLIFVYLKLPIIESMLFAVSVGYGVMLIWNVILLHRYFPDSDRSPFTFLDWVDLFTPLALSGFFVNFGLFCHLVIMWFSELQVKVMGLFIGAPQHDVPALLAFMTILVTTVNFVVSVEVKFYPKYRNHYSLYNDKGTIGDIKLSETEMINTLKTEIFYTALKQLLTSAFFIAAGGYILDVLPLGFNELMRGYFRTLCVAYGLYAVGNMVMLMQLYFTDYKGAVISTGAFAACSFVFSIISLFFSSVYYGFGFLLASLIFVITAIVRLDYFTKRLPYYILSVQDLVSEDKTGVFTRLGKLLDEKIK